MEEEDIKILEEFIEHIKFVEERTLYELEAKERCKKRYKAIENLLKAYKQDEKMIDLMAEYIDFDKMDFNCSSLCIKEGCQEDCIKEYFRKKVETNE